MNVMVLCISKKKISLKPEPIFAATLNSYFSNMVKQQQKIIHIVLVSNWCFSFAPELVGYSAPRDLHRRAAYSICESWFLIHQDVYHDLFVCS